MNRNAFYLVCGTDKFCNGAACIECGVVELIKGLVYHNIDYISSSRCKRVDGKHTEKIPGTRQAINNCIKIYTVTTRLAKQVCFQFGFEHGTLADTWQGHHLLPKFAQPLSMVCSQISQFSIIYVL